MPTLESMVRVTKYPFLEKYVDIMKGSGKVVQLTKKELGHACPWTDIVLFLDEGGNLVTQLGNIPRPWLDRLMTAFSVTNPNCEGNIGSYLLRIGDLGCKVAYLLVIHDTHYKYKEYTNYTLYTLPSEELTVRGWLLSETVKLLTEDETPEKLLTATR